MHDRSFLRVKLQFIMRYYNSVNLEFKMEHSNLKWNINKKSINVILNLKWNKWE